PARRSKSAQLRRRSPWTATHASGKRAAACSQTPAKVQSDTVTSVDREPGWGENRASVVPPRQRIALLMSRTFVIVAHRELMGQAEGVADVAVARGVEVMSLLRRG